LSKFGPLVCTAHTLAVIAHFMKKQKNPENEKASWDRESTKKLILLALTFVVFFISIYILPSYIRDRKANKLNGVSSGIVVKIKPKSISTQGFYGQKESIYSYELTFVYTVDSKTYTNTNDFPTKGKYVGLISSIRKSNFTKKVDINYNEKNPQESIIIVE
jgi:hypothetical protein